MDFFQKYKSNILKIIGLFAFLVATYLFIHFLNFIFNTRDEQEIHFLIFLATVALGIIAYYEFNRSHKLTSNEFLLFISNRWGKKEIIKARQILHNLFVGAYRDENGKSKEDYNTALFNVSEQILQMSRIKEENGKEFIYLLNLLDYLETLSYFFNRGDLKLKDVQNTCGNNAIFFFELFKLYVSQRQLHEKSAFINYSRLYHTLKKSQLKQN
jgi:hypothetical protein